MLNATSVRAQDSALSQFLRYVPVLPEELTKEAQKMVGILKARRLVSDITFEDVLGDVRTHALSPEESVACLKWWAQVWATGKGSDALKAK